MTVRSLALVGCAAATLFAATGCGTQIGTEDAPGCRVIAESPISDLDLQLDGFELTPREAFDATLGSYTGDFMLEDQSGAVGVQLTFAGAGAFVVQERELYAPGGDGLDANAGLCDTRYAAAVDVTAVVDGLLDEAGPGLLTISQRGETAFVLSVALDAVQGPARPEWLDLDAVVDPTLEVMGAGSTLSPSGELTNNRFNGVALFQGMLRDQPRRGGLVQDSEGLGSFDLERDPVE